MRPFTYERATTPQAARTAFSATSKVPVEYLAGGTTLLDLMKLDVMQPGKVVDVTGIGAALSEIKVSDTGLYLGALVKMSTAADHPEILSNYPVIAQSLQLAASAQLRNMATLGGNVLQRTRCPYFRNTSWTACNKRNPGAGCAALNGVNRTHALLGGSDECIATYPGDFAQALIALDATLDILGASGMQRIPFAALHRQPGTTPNIETTLRPGDLIAGFHIPAGPWTQRSLYLKIRDRQSYEFALTSAAVALHLDGGTVRQARIALGGVASVPWRAIEAESALTGKTLDETSACNAARIAFSSAVPRTHNAFKIALGQATLVRALLQAAKET